MQNPINPFDRNEHGMRWLPAIIISVLVLTSAGAILWFQYHPQETLSPINNNLDTSRTKEAPANTEPIDQQSKTQARSSSNSISVPVLVLSYFPVKPDGSVDTNRTSDWRDPDLNALRTRVNTLTDLTVAALTEGSTYHGYKNPSTVPYLSYRIHEKKEFLRSVPYSMNARSRPNADHITILTRDANVCHYVDELGVREVWIWMQDSSEVGPIESNMSMGTVSKQFWNYDTYGDVSNSARSNDLPQCAHTYTVYDYNYGRGLSESVEDHGHQLESIFNFLDPNLFMNKFILPYGKTDGTVNHCGNTHNPPNARNDYDWFNMAPVITDCEDWKPDGGGQTKQVSCFMWSNPQGSSCASSDPLKDAGAGWKIYWMQNMPGYQNGLTYQGRRMRNWWEFVADFDSAIALGENLTE